MDVWIDAPSVPGGWQQIWLGASGNSSRSSCLGLREAMTNFSVIISCSLEVGASISLCQPYTVCILSNSQTFKFKVRFQEKL